MALIAHLRGDARFPCGPGQLAGFPNGVCVSGFFDINVFARLDGANRRRRMVMIGDGDSHRIDGLFLLQHDTIIAVSARRDTF